MNHRIVATFGKPYPVLLSFSEGKDEWLSFHFLKIVQRIVVPPSEEAMMMRIINCI